MLHLEKFISKGGSRLCFAHPQDPKLCVKVPIQPIHAAGLQQELDTYLLVKEELSDYIVSYQPKLVETQLGWGLVCELIRNDDGNYAPDLIHHLIAKGCSDEVHAQLNSFAKLILEKDIFFFDFNWGNFLVQTNDGCEKLLYSDLKSYKNYKPWTFLRAERIFPALARNRMRLRLNRIIRDVEGYIYTPAALKSKSRR